MNESLFKLKLSSSLQSFDSDLNRTALIKQHKWPLKIYNAHHMSISSSDICTTSAITGQLPYNELAAGYLKTDYVQGISLQYSDTLKQTMAASRPKKRRKLIFSQSPWHKVVLQGSDICHSISVSDKEWALATNKICEKVGPRETIHPSKKRLVLSTHLMQQLLQPTPTFVLSDNARFNYEIVMYFVSRITLGSACCLMTKTISGKTENLKAASDQDQEYSPLKEKIQKLEIDLQRLEKTTSMVDIITEIHNLETFSTLNHLAKFHSRAQVTNSSVYPSTFTTTRYVVRITMPRNLPEPVHYLPL